MILYGVVTGTSIGDIFIAGIMPGILMFVMLAGYCFFAYGKLPRLPRASFGEILKVTKRALPTLGFPVIIMGGIYSGMLTPTEAAVAAVLYALILEMLLYRTINFKTLCRIAVSSGMVSAVVFIIIAGGQALSWMISYARLPQEILPALLGPDPSALYILVIASIVFFLGALLVDPYILIIIMCPMFLPSVVNAGVDPVHFGIVVLMQAVLGNLTPPFGPNIFTACAVFNKPYLDVIRGVAPYVVIVVILCALIIIFPQISLCLL
jgi:tripartite ATP-independent transporter DctM subunit